MTLAFETHGSGLPLVLLHAFPLSRAMWQAQLPLAQSCRLILPDLPGFGESALDPNVNIDAMAEAVAAMLDSIPLSEPAVLGGCSMGGYVALAFARKFPERLRGLLLIDTRPEPDDEAAKGNRNKMIDAAGSLTATDVIVGMLPRVLGSTTREGNPNAVAEVRRLGSSQPVPGIIAAQRAMRDRPDSQPILAGIRVPTAVIVGAEDVITPPDVAERMAAKIAGSQLRIIPSCGHLPNVEQPEAFNAIVANFMKAEW